MITIKNEVITLYFIAHLLKLPVSTVNFDCVPSSNFRPFIVVLITPTSPHSVFLCLTIAIVYTCQSKLKRIPNIYRHYVVWHADFKPKSIDNNFIVWKCFHQYNLLRSARSASEIIIWHICYTHTFYFEIQ